MPFHGVARARHHEALPANTTGAGGLDAHCSIRTAAARPRTASVGHAARTVPGEVTGGRRARRIARQHHKRSPGHGNSTWPHTMADGGAGMEVSAERVDQVGAAVQACPARWWPGLVARMSGAQTSEGV